MSVQRFIRSSRDIISPVKKRVSRYFLRNLQFLTRQTTYFNIYAAYFDAQTDYSGGLLPRNTRNFTEETGFLSTRKTQSAKFGVYTQAG